MPAESLSEYNRDQLTSFHAVARACADLPASEVERLRALAQPYLRFREAIDAFSELCFGAPCRMRCFETDLSACCGFESIFTFFADHVVNFLCSSLEELTLIESVLSRPNGSARCVYLGGKGCLFHIRPISCAMFFCEEVKKSVFDALPDSELLWKQLREQEKEFTWPVKPVLFDELEAAFMRLGVESPHLYFHQSPGLLRVKAKAGLSVKPPNR